MSLFFTHQICFLRCNCKIFFFDGQIFGQFCHRRSCLDQLFETQIHPEKKKPSRPVPTPPPPFARLIKINRPENPYLCPNQRGRDVENWTAIRCLLFSTLSLWTFYLVFWTFCQICFLSGMGIARCLRMERGAILDLSLTYVHLS